MDQFRIEMNKLMTESLKEYQEKALRNQETIGAIKESIKNNKQNLSELNKKIEDYYSNLDAVSKLINSEIEVIKKNLPNKNNLSAEEKAKIEQNLKSRSQDSQNGLSVQQNLEAEFAKLKEEIEQNVMYSLEHSSDTEGEEKIQRILTEITANMEQKIHKVLDHLNGKVSVLEKQVNNYSRYDDPIIDKIKFEIEDKLNEHEQYYGDQLTIVKKTIEQKTDENLLRNYLST